MKGLAIRMGLMLASVLLTLLVFEGFLRLFYNYRGNLKQMSQFDPDLGWGLVPGTYHVGRSHALVSHDIHINDLGLRNREISMHPAQGTKRVVMLGDSFTFGMMVPAEDLLASVAERELVRRGHEIEVVNTGLEGYGTAQQLILTRRLHEQGFRADIFVVAFYTNDLIDNLGLSPVDFQPQLVIPRFARTPQGGVALVHAPEFRFHQRGSITQSGGTGFRLHTKDFVISRVIGILQSRGGLVKLAQRLGIEGPRTWIPSMVRGWYDAEFSDPGWDLTTALLLELRREVRSHGADLAIAFIPSIVQIYDAYPLLLGQRYPDDPRVRAFLDDPLKPQGMMEDFCRREEIPYLDLEAAIREQGSEGKIYSTADYHLSSAGHQIVGEEIAALVTHLLADASRVRSR